MTRGEAIKQGIKDRIDAVKASEIISQRQRISRAISAETERIYKAAENLKMNEFEPVFKVKLDEDILLPEVKEEFIKEGFEFKNVNDTWYVYLAD